MDRRSFLKKAGLTGSALLGAKLLPGALGREARALAQSANEPPNILFVMVDQMRFPQWFPQPATLDKLLPSLARLEASSVSFREHYTAANACTPSRGCLLTGLYAHQTGCLITNAQSQPALDPGFPTWGTLLRGVGYETYWYGKWHLSASCDLEPFGFSGGTCPSPNGAPGQGLASDPGIVDQFLGWLEAQGDRGPWCTTVSLVNPHDISFYYRFTDHVPGESDPPRVFTELPGNFERPADLLEQRKPGLQRALQETSATGNGVLPFRGSDFEAGWLKMLDLYLQLQRDVDAQIGRVLQALDANPALAARTIVIFTADHGEYGGSHGLRGKGGAVYDEAIHVPLYVKDPTGRFARRPDVERRQLTSSVDMTPLLLTLATGDNTWRTLPQYAHLAQRLDVAAILRDPTAPGRPYVLHTTDEDFVEELALNPFQRDVPSHVIGCRTATAKLATYSFWAPGSIEIQTSGQETECYDYSTPDGQMELTNLAPEKPPLYNRLYDALVNDAIPNELRQPLPSNLQSAQQAGINAYLTFEQQQADSRG